jgi:hypothetical protein
MLKRLGSRQSNLTGLKDAEEGPSVLLIESEQSCDSMVRRSRKAFLTKAPLVALYAFRVLARLRTRGQAHRAGGAHRPAQ